MSKVTEIAHLTIKPESVQDFLTGIEEGAAIIARQPACSAVHVSQCVEEPTKFLLMADWDDIAGHVAFRDRDDFSKYRGTVQATFAEPPSFQHYKCIIGD